MYKHLILLDKPAGITSRNAVEIVKNAVGAKKAGHAGTLDINVSGVLIIALDEARKAMPVLMNLDKAYIGVMHIHSDKEREVIEKYASTFVGEIEQLPPKKSAVARVIRKRRVYEFKILGMKGRDVEFFVKCQAGTYIRKLIHDLGQKMGCGAHMKRLRRVAVNGFKIEETVSMEDVKKGKGIIKLEDVAERLNVNMVFVDKNIAYKIKNGMPIYIDKVKIKRYSERNKYTFIYDSSGIIALGIIKSNKLLPDRVFNV